MSRRDDAGAPAGGDSGGDPAAAILILLVTPEVIAANPPGAFEVLGEQELAGFASASGPRRRFAGLRVPGAKLLCPRGRADVRVVGGARRRHGRGHHAGGL